MTAKNSNLNKKLDCKKLQWILNVIFLVGLVYLLYSFNKSQDNVNQLSVDGKIENWVKQNPNVIFESIIAMQQNQYKKKVEEAKNSIISKKNELLNDNSDPAYSPQGYDITIVEFFDYNCGYCKRAGKTVKSLLAKDKKVKFVYKEFPILGKASEDLSKVALAVNMIDPKKYKLFHDALMSSKIRTKNGAINKAKKLGINIQKLKKVLKNKDKEISAKIDKTRNLAQSLNISGTPAFIIGNELIPGAVNLKDLERLIAQERNK